ncbi:MULTISPECIES: exonuclease domain-containing protein [Streptomycetaceae]|uniref:DNA polymerase III subunit epsilon n=1 Tax=Streptantibioticus cattleyicolor (strain ATCC 35852 / DSM 46488 / JCM 4925 / NBRC 14057 / NRRL 8057) TaxID=1003195 RepID=F8JSW6_STREN|nr:MULTISPECIES: exonuclease domain-containing protein [Streptomycetaceae]AEW97657.1 DNA polymerase III subunit epsilon [Streptantibioticus cattleyicolor NRRL 8057 = DSM 46488]MYS62083.1 3'-5' exonuclease [Streptomyces sp. SID5468]CCB77977.1 putative DNA polymerase III epsilon subunit [Streptantibioticus cattleyicolor NRRL 8057 = DSM 46488]
MPSWFDGPLAAFDTETTGVDVERDRIVTAALVVQERPGATPWSRRWLISPGVPVPEAATAVHGLSDGYVARHGVPPGPAVEAIARALAGGPGAGLPLVVMNAPFDLTLLDRELHRHRGTGLDGYWSQEPLCVLDPRVLDKHADRYRKGRRTLSDLCAHYDVALTDAHDAAADALAALEVTRAIGRRFADGGVGGMTPAELHVRQALWHAAQARGLQAWFARNGSPERCDPAWPLRPRLPRAA